MSLGQKILAQYLEGEGADPAVQKAAQNEAVEAEREVYLRRPHPVFGQHIRVTIDRATGIAYIHTTTDLAKMAEEAFRKITGRLANDRTTKGH